MIFLYSGTPGSGKSLHTASQIYWRLRNNKPVLANFDIALEKVKKRPKRPLPFEYKDNLELTPQYCVQYARNYFSGKKRVKEGKLLLVIDECQILFNSRDWNKPGRTDWLKFFTQHRKYGFDIILIAQFDEMIDKQVRALIEYEVIHRKVSNFGLAGFFFSLVFFGKLFVSVKFWYPIKERVGSEFFLASKRYYQIYDTFGDFGQMD